MTPDPNHLAAARTEGCALGLIEARRIAEHVQKEGGNLEGFILRISRHAAAADAAQRAQWIRAWHVRPINRATVAGAKKA